MSTARLILLTSATMVAFAGNSILCRLALKETAIDAASFTTVRLISGALVLAVLTRTLKSREKGEGNWLSALALFGYAALFSFAYLQLSAATGALLLFVAVQATMIVYGIWRGERLNALQLCGLVAALSGLVGLLMPGLTAPPTFAAILMLGSGVAWGIYSLRGRGAGSPLGVTAGNFLLAVPMGLLLSLLMLAELNPDMYGVGLAIASGAVASGLGYAVWYTVLPSLEATTAATVQLSVPVIAALAGILLLDEALSLRLVLASLAVLGGIGLVIRKRQ